MAEPNPYGGGMTMAEVSRLMAGHRAAYRPPPTEFRVTREQLDHIRRSVPILGEHEGMPTAMLGIPVVIVDTEQESTLFAMTWESLVRRLGGRP